jgi:hypothetical protein
MITSISSYYQDFSATKDFATIGFLKEKMKFLPNEQEAPKLTNGPCDICTLLIKPIEYTNVVKGSQVLHLKKSLIGASKDKGITCMYYVHPL